MGFSVNSYARVWSVEDKGKYSIANISVSKKNKDTNQYEIKFQSNYVRLVGTAHDALKDVEIPEKGGVSIKISNCDVESNYDAENKKMYYNFAIFGLELLDDNNSGGKKKSSSKDAKSKKPPKTKTAKHKEEEEELSNDEDEDDLPF